MKNTCFKFRSFFLRFGPGFAAGVAAGAALTLWSGSSCRPPEAPGGLGGAGQSPPEYIDIAAPKPERVEPLSWRVALLTGERDARFPVISISANRNMFTADATNGVEGIALLHGGRQIPFKVVDAPDPGTTNNWFDISPLNPVEPGELEVRISKDFPDPAGMPAPAPSWWTAQYAPVPVTIEHVESKAEAFCGDAKTTLWLNREVSEETLGANLVFKPEVSGISITRVGERCWNDAGGYTHGWDSPRYEICGSFKPGTRYRVGFASRLMETEDGCVALSSTNAVAFTASGADSAIEWLDGGMNLGGENLGAAVAIRADRVPRVEISAQRILPGNLVFALRNWDAWTVDNDDWCESPVSRIAEDFAPDGVATNLVALDDFSPAGGPRLPDGLWFVRVLAMPRADEPQDVAMSAPLSRLVARSDTAITARCLSDEVVVWTTRISTGLPATNCTVALYARNNTVVAEGAVDSTGVAVLSPGKSDYPPVLAVASAPDGQYSFLELKYANYLDEMPERPGDVFAADAAQLDGWIGCDRGIYRHGERVFVEALVRDAAGKAPERRPVVMNVERGDGTGVMHWNLMTDERGRASPPNGFFQIPDSQPSGTWRISLSTPGSDGVELASRKFRVEAFVPPKIKVSIADLPGVFTPDRAPGAPDAPGAIEAGISSRYFHGSPASGLAYEAFAYAAAAPFSPEGWDGSWVVGAPSRTCGNLRGKRVKGSLGSDGSDCAEVPLPHLPNPPAAVLRLRVQTSVFEHGGRAVTAEKCTDWHVYPYYIAVKEPVGAKPGAHVSFPVRLVLPDGSAATNAPAALKAALSTVRTEWLWEKKTGEDGWAWRRHRIEREIGSGEFAVADAVSAVDFTLAQGVHDYVLRISPAGDAPGEGAFAPLTELEFSGGEAEAPAAANPDRIEIKCDGKSYAPGSVAKVSLRAPFDGIALVTLQQRSLVEHRLVTVSNGTATVEIPVERALAPSFDIAASLVRAAAPGEEWPEHRAFGAATVAVENPAADLAAAMPQPAVSPLPGGGWRVSAEVSLAAAETADGARATFFLVDEAVLALTDEKAPDPTARFGRPRWSGARLYDSFRRLLRLRGGRTVKTAATGGDALAAGAMGRRLQASRTRRFSPLARAVQDVPFSGGKAVAAFDLPEFSGEVRIAAIAWSATATGSASASATLAPALVLEADGPRFLAPGDKTSLSLAVVSTAAEAASAEWTLAAAPFVSTGGVLSLPPRGSAVVRVPVEIPQDASCGEIAAVFGVSGLGEEHRDTLLLPLRAALPPAAFSDSVCVEPGETAALDPVPGLSGVSFAALRADPNPWADFAPALRALAAYEWRCLEQTSSRAFAALAGSGAARALAPDAFADADGEIDGAVARVLTMLRGNAFVLWPESFVENPLYGAWAGLFLAEAEAAGRELPPSSSARLRSALQHYANRSAPGRKWDDTAQMRASRERDYSEARAMALLALRTAGEPNPDSEAALLDRADSLSDEARAVLALSLLRGGRPDEAMELLQRIDPLSSPPRALAWAIAAWSETDTPQTAERVEALRQALLAKRSQAAAGGSHWGSTLDNAVAVAAAAAALERWGSASEAAPSVVASADGAADVVLTNTLFAAVEAGAGAGKVSIQNRGASRILVERRVEGAPQAGSFAATTNGIAVARRYFSPDGEPLDPEDGSIRRGDTVFAEISVMPFPDAGATLESVVIDELLPAGLEPQIGAEAPQRKGGAPALNTIHREVRDDRITVFAGEFSGERVFRYAAQAVSDGSFALPPVQAGEMYRPRITGTAAPGRLVISE